MKLLHFIRRYGVVIACCIAALSGGFFLGHMTAPREKTPSVEISATEAPTVQNIGEQPAENVSQTGETAVLPTTDVIWSDYYKKCGHEYVTFISDDVLGMTRSELEEKYKDYEIAIMTSETVRFVRTIDGYCPSHFLLKTLGDNVLCVMRTDPETHTLTQVKEFPFDLDSLDAGVLEQLKAGMVFDTEDEINAFLEDIES